jgi:DNA-binding transcriptional regulator YiaG
VNALRQLRNNAHLSQRDLAGLLDVPVNTFRMWDSGLRPVPCGILDRAKASLVKHARDTELVSLDQLAAELGVHQRTLRTAARTGRLAVQFSSRSVFGRPIRRATRQAAAAFMERYYKQSYSRFAVKPRLPDTHVPSDVPQRLKRLRRKCRLTQAQLAKAIGAANKAVVYQWESGLRKPSPVFWQKIAELEKTSITARRHLLAR